MRELGGSAASTCAPGFLLGGGGPRGSSACTPGAVGAPKCPPRCSPHLFAPPVNVPLLQAAFLTPAGAKRLREARKGPGVTQQVEQSGHRGTRKGPPRDRCDGGLRAAPCWHLGLCVPPAAPPGGWLRGVCSPNGNRWELGAVCGRGAQACQCVRVCTCVCWGKQQGCVGHLHVPASEPVCTPVARRGRPCGVRRCV